MTFVNSRIWFLLSLLSGLVFLACTNFKARTLPSVDPQLTSLDRMIISHNGAPLQAKDQRALAGIGSLDARWTRRIGEGVYLQAFSLTRQPNLELRIEAKGQGISCRWQNSQHETLLNSFHDLRQAHWGAVAVNDTQTAEENDALLLFQSLASKAQPGESLFHLVGLRFAKQCLAGENSPPDSCQCLLYLVPRRGPNTEEYPLAYDFQAASAPVSIQEIAVEQAAIFDWSPYRMGRPPQGLMTILHHRVVHTTDSNQSSQQAILSWRWLVHDKNFHSVLLCDGKGEACRHQVRQKSMRSLASGQCRAGEPYWVFCLQNQGDRAFDQVFLTKQGSARSKYLTFLLFDRLQSTRKPFAHAKRSLQVAWPEAVDVRLYEVSDFWVSEPGRLSILFSPIPDLSIKSLIDARPDSLTEQTHLAPMVVQYDWREMPSE